jgi:hypothetical protein
MMNVENYMVIPEVHNLFADAILADEAGNLVFGSFWGNDTSVRDFQGRLTLASQEGGMTGFSVMADIDGRTRQERVRISNIEHISQMTGRVHTVIYGDLVHCYLHHIDVIKPDLANHRALLISTDEQPQNLWNAVKAICPVPLLDHWQGHIMRAMVNAKMIKQLTGINQYGTKIEIDEDDMADIVREGCRSGVLALSELDVTEVAA